MYEKLALGYKLEFDRQSSNTLFKDDDTISRNIIIINIKNSIGVTIYSLKMNEADCIRLMDYITIYLYDFYDWGDECNIKLSISSSSTGKYPIIHFQNISNQINTDNKNYIYTNVGEYRYHELTIIEADANNSMTKILSVPMANTEIEEFVFNLYFVGLMDLVLPDEIYQKLDDILCRIFGDNWYNYN